MSLSDFYTLMENCDWYYEFADDGNAYRAGQQSYSKVVGLSRLSAGHGKLFQDFHDYMFSGEAWGTPKLPKPDRPSETT